MVVMMMMLQSDDDLTAFCALLNSRQPMHLAINPSARVQAAIVTALANGWTLEQLADETASRSRGMRGGGGVVNALQTVALEPPRTASNGQAIYGLTDAGKPRAKPPCTCHQHCNGNTHDRNNTPAELKDPTVIWGLAERCHCNS